MANDPLYRDERQFKRMMRDSQIVAQLTRLQWIKLGTGLVALAPIAAIWLTWRIG